MSAPAITIRPIAPADDPAVAAIIRQVMTEHGAVGDGFAITDREVDGMWSAYARGRRAYFVAELDGRVAGGGGIAPLDGGDGATCELRKMYFLSELRGRGVGRELLALCLDAARGFGYARCYLETLASMGPAQRLYTRAGFRPLDAPCGATGHHGCDAYYALDL